MPAKSLVSVVMAVYNTPPRFLREAIESILKQTYTEFEFIILDDGSRNIAEIEYVVKGFCDTRIVFQRNDKNLGIAESYNRLIALAQGEYLAIMNHDDVALPQRLQKQLAFMESHPEIGICGTGFQRFGKLLKRRTIRYSEDDAEIRGLMLFKCPIHHPSAMIRKSALTKNGICYDQHYLTVNDRKLFFDLATKTKLHNLPDILMRYRLHRGMTTHQIAHVLKQEQQAFRDCYFRHLGVTFNVEELHVIDEYLTCGKTPIYNIIVLKQIENILLRLSDANKRVCFAGEEGFNKMLKRYFLKRCLNAAVYGRVSSRELIKYSPLLISKKEKPFSLWLLNRLLRLQDVLVLKEEKKFPFKLSKRLPGETVIPKSGNQRNKGVIYTCITAGYDDLTQHTHSDLNWDYICFSDMPALLERKKIGFWQIRPLVFNELDPVRNARWHKLHPHCLLPEYDYSIWLDANINVVSGFLFQRAAECVAAQRIVSAPAHFERTCIYEEAKVVKVLRRDYPEIIDRQMAVLRDNGFPQYVGLNETGLLFRLHHHELSQEMMEAWWIWIRDYSRRDQLSFNFIIWLFQYPLFNFVEKPGLRDNGANFEITYSTSHHSVV